MKHNNLLPKVVLTALCTSTALFSFAQAQGIIKGVGKELFQAPRLTRGTVQRFVFPRTTVNNIRTGIAAGKLDRMVDQASLQSPAALIPSPPTIAFHNRSLVSGYPVEKEVLTVMANEEAFYAPEIEAGRTIRQQILDITVLEDEGLLAIVANIHNYIKNHTLQSLLLEELENYDIYNMALDLTDYFTLDKSFENAAFDYTIRHPHQMNLNMRRLMYNPLVDPAVKNRLKYFFQAHYIPLESYPSFRTAIRTAYLQYNQRIAVAQGSDIIIAQIRYYKDLTNQLSDFIVKNDRLPKWNTRSTKEADLFDELEWIFMNDRINQFPQIQPFREALQAVYDSAPAPTILSMDETIALFEEFVKTTHRRYPNSLRDKLKKGQIPFEQEELLWDSLEHWRIESESTIRPALTGIINRYQID